MNRDLPVDRSGSANLPVPIRATPTGDALPLRTERRHHERRTSGGVDSAALVVAHPESTVQAGELQIFTVQVSINRQGLFVRTSMPQMLCDVAPDDPSKTSKKKAPAANANWVSVDETCLKLRVGKSKLYDLMQDGEISYVRPGRERLIAEAEIETYLARLANKKAAFSTRSRAKRNKNYSK
ncbi:MAG TPA: helix-turn-helix domain-containing protein [Candidatus Acidoferrales bacterium]|nr:helix-turn-helix domain-containing protein [Candidatus Acidoferrales bacterium]